MRVGWVDDPAQRGWGGVGLIETPTHLPTGLSDGGPKPL